MSSVFVKLYQREKGNKYRKLLSTDASMYQPFSQFIASTYPYDAGTTLDWGEWFYIEEASKQAYALGIITDIYESVDFDSLNRNDFAKIDFLFTFVGNDIYIQNVSKTKLVSKKHIFYFGEAFKYEPDCNDLVINEYPDAIYHKEDDRLYFQKLESITSIFKGIDQLYKEATEDETEDFLNHEFITLKRGYSATNVKTANRKRIALAQKTLNNLSKSDRENIFNYIGDYCPNLKVSEKTFEVGSENDLKLLLFGIEQRFYTTPVGGEKRIANSVSPFGNDVHNKEKNQQMFGKLED